MGKIVEGGTSINIPRGRQWPGHNESTPHVLIGDESSALTSYFMRVFTRKHAGQGRRKDKYNYIACRVVATASTF